MPETRLDWKMEPEIYPEEILFLYILWNSLVHTPTTHLNLFNV